MKIRLQAALAAVAASLPLALGAAWAASAETALEPMLALGLGLGGAGIVAALWSRDVRRVAGGGRAPVLPVHDELATRLSRLAATAAASEALAESRAGSFAAVLEALPDPVVALDATQGLVRANAAARALFSGAADLPALLRHPAVLERVAHSGASGRVETAEIAMAVPVERLLQVQIVPVSLADGTQPVRMLLVLRDRTREAALERMRQDFVANASHELRTPLTSLIGFIETLRGPAEGDVAAQRRFLAIMHEQGERMRRLLDDLLSLSQIEMTEHAAPSGQADLAALARRVADMFEPRLAARGQRLDLSVEAASVPGDAEQLAQVVSNLLDNAVKYGREGGAIGLAVRRVAPATGTARGARRPGVAIAVSDDGAGIAPEHLPRLTERFYRVDAGRSRAVGGTGLGLAIVKHIVNRHRGRLEIESAPGRGSTFTVWLPEG